MGKPKSPRDIPQEMGSNLVLVKGERLFPEDMGRRVAQLLALLFGDGLSSLDTHLLRKGLLGSGTPVDRGSRVWRGRRRALRGIHVPHAEGGGARAKPKKLDRPPGICSIADGRVEGQKPSDNAQYMDTGGASPAKRRLGNLRVLPVQSPQIGPEYSNKSAPEEKAQLAKNRAQIGEKQQELEHSWWR